jgi:hypothetical protein
VTSLAGVDSDFYALREIRTINLNVEAGGGGTIFPLPGSHSYPVGQQITITPVPDRYCDFDYWSGDVSGEQTPITLTVGSDLNITANFFRIYPPSNLDVRHELNRTVLMGEDINVVTWQDNPSNPSQKITSYNLYYQPAGGTLSSPQSPIEGENTYWHRNVDKTQTYDYSVCAVTTRGVEGEPSFRTMQGETGPETTGRTRSTTTEQDVTGNKAREVIPIIIGSSAKEADEERVKNILKPLNFAAQRAFDTTIPEWRYVNILSWQANPENQSVDQYRIYVVEEKGRRLLAELEGDAYEFIHKEVEMNKTYKYALVAVDTEKRECQPVYTEIK